MCIYIYIYTYTYICICINLAHTCISWCPLELGKLNAFIFIRFGCFVSALSRTPAAPQTALAAVLMLHTHPFLPYSPSTLSFTFPFLLSCPQAFDNLCTNSSAAGALSTPSPSTFPFLAPFLSVPPFCCLVLDLSTNFTIAPPPLVLAEAAAATVFAPAPLPLVLTDAAAAAVFAPASPPLMLAEAAAAAVFALAPPPLVLAEGRGLAGLLGCRRM